MLALESISANGKVLVTKDKKYIIGIESSGYTTKYYVIDNYGEKFYIKKEEIVSKFKLSEKEQEGYD